MVTCLLISVCLGGGGYIDSPSLSPTYKTCTVESRLKPILVTLQFMGIEGLTKNIMRIECLMIMGIEGTSVFCLFMGTECASEQTHS